LSDHEDAVSPTFDAPQRSVKWALAARRRVQRLRIAELSQSDRILEAGLEDPLQYDASLLRQGGRCGLCGRSPAESRPLVFGTVACGGRTYLSGLVCGPCSSRVSAADRMDGGSTDLEAKAYIRGILDLIRAERAPAPEIFACPVCGKRYRHRENLRQHTERKHKQIPKSSELLR
jgi:hypothetical protein